MPRITPNLWFDDQAETAAAYYVSLFPDARILRTDRYGAESAAASGRPAGSVMTVAFELGGQRFVALNGGPLFKFSGAVSFVVECESQPELDRLWDGLADGGEPFPCGWVRDRFGMTWQVLPAGLDAMLRDPQRSGPVWQAMLTMKKLDGDVLRRAWEGG